MDINAFSRLFYTKLVTRHGHLNIKIELYLLSEIRLATASLLGRITLHRAGFHIRSLQTTSISAFTVVTQTKETYENKP